MPPSALILCGGKSSRMGTDKALLPVAGRPLLARVIDGLQSMNAGSAGGSLTRAPPSQAAAGPLFAQVLLAVGPALRYTEFGVPTVLDELTDVGPIAGLHAGLKAMAGDRAMVVACDMPFVESAVIGRLLELSDGFDAVVPKIDGEFEPMCAVYTKACVSAIEKAVKAGRRRMIGFLEDVRVRVVSEAELRELDAGLMSLKNLNRPAEWESYFGRL